MVHSPRRRSNRRSESRRSSEFTGRKPTTDRRQDLAPMTCSLTGDERHQANHPKHHDQHTSKRGLGGPERLPAPPRVGAGRRRSDRVLGQRRGGWRGPPLQRPARWQVRAHGRALHRVHADDTNRLRRGRRVLRHEKLFERYGFAINLESVGPDRTEVAIETHYTPRNPLYGLLNRLMMRRQFRKVCDELLAGLRAFAESRDRSPASKAGGIPAAGERPAGAAPAS